jgi:solute:Na+ symporter, SSS family
VHFYWIGAVPAMVFLGVVMMPFYYGSKVRSVPEYLRLRFNDATHMLNSISFAVATILIAGVNLFAIALVIRLLLGWPIPISIVLAAAIVLVYITLGGLSSAIYNEVLQFFVIVAALVPLTIVGLKAVGGWNRGRQRGRGGRHGGPRRRGRVGAGGPSPPQTPYYSRGFFQHLAPVGCCLDGCVGVPDQGDQRRGSRAAAIVA